MNDDILDLRFERDLRAVLAELDPAEAPASLSASVAGVTRRRPGRDWPVIRFAAGLVGLAAVVTVAVVLLSGSLRGPGPAPVVGGPDATGVPASVAPGELIMTRFELALVPADGGSPADDQVRALAGVLRDRLYRAGYEHSIEAAPAGIVVLVALDPGDADGRRLVTDRLTTVGRVDFVPMGQEAPSVGNIVDLAAHPPLLGGDAVEQAAIGLDQTGGRTVDLTLDAAATRVFADHTSTHIGDALAITLDGRVITAPFILSAIQDGQVQVSGGTAEGFPVEEARRLVDILETGALPVPVELVATVAATPTPRPAGFDAGLVTDQGRACAELASTPRTERISIGEDRGAVLLSGDVPDQAALVYVDACLWQRTASGVLATDSTGGTVGADVPDQVSVDRVVGSGSAPWHHLVAGRVGPGEGGVRVALDDGSTVDAVVRDGWWLAWWEGEAGPTLVQRLDGAGAVVAEVKAAEGPPEAVPAATTEGAAPAALAVDALVRSSCGSIGGCAYTVVLGDGDHSWNADLAGDGSDLEPGPGLPATLEPGTYTLTMTSYFLSDAIRNGSRPVGPVSTTCSALLVVEPGTEVVGATATFDRDACTIEVVSEPAP